MSSSKSSTSFNSNMNNNYSNNPFSSEGFIERTNGGNLSSYEINAQSQTIISPASVIHINSHNHDLSVLSLINEEKNYFVLSQSSIPLIVKYEKGQNEATIVYKEIIYKNEKGDLEKTNIEEVKDYNPYNNNIKEYYKKFICYLEKVEKELKADYKKEKETEIILTIKKKESKIDKEFCLSCNFLINDGRKEIGEESEFLVSNIFNEKDEFGLSCMIDALR